MPPHLPPLSALCRVLLLSVILACAALASPARPQQASGPDGTTLKRQVEEDAGAFRKFVIQNGISFLPGPEYPAQEAEREKAYRVVLALLDILDGEAPAQALRDIAACRAAGFVHDPQQAIAETSLRLPSWPWEEKEEIVRDRHAVLGGLLAADRDFALVFGQPEPFLRENTPLRIAWSPAQALPDPPSPEEARILRRLPPGKEALSLERIRMGIVSNFHADAALTLREKRGFSVCPVAGSRSHDYQSDPHFPCGIALAGACRTREYALLIREAARSRTHLRRLGAYLYGIYVESCFLASLMPPGKDAHGGGPACPALLRGLAGRLGRGLHLLGREGMLGNGEENERRSALVEQLQRLLTAGVEAEATARLRRIVSLTRAERARHLSPFRP